MSGAQYVLIINISLFTILLFFYIALDYFLQRILLLVFFIIELARNRFSEYLWI